MTKKNSLNHEPIKSIPIFDFWNHLFQIVILHIWRFEIRNFKTQKWASMFLTYLVENFFLVILRRRIFFGLQKFSKKMDFSVNFLRFYSSGEAVWSARRLIFWPVKMKRFSVSRFFAWGSATNIWPQITRQSSRSISSSSDRLASTLKRTGRVNFLMSVLETMGQLYTVRLLECKNWSTLKVNLKSSFGSLATLRYIIYP
jgi:hypothetical protein